MPSQPLYKFEKVPDPQKRSRQDAHADARVFLRRLVPPDDAGHETPIPQLDTPTWNLLLSFCLAYSLNIAWYEENANKQIRKNRILTVVLVIALLWVAGAMFSITWYSTTVAGNAYAWISAQLGFLVLSVFALLEMAVGALDTRDRIRIFWETGAELKNRLYTFENQWRRNVLTPEGTLKREFIVALEHELAEARILEKAERLQFFQTMASPSSIVAAVRDRIQGAFLSRPPSMGPTQNDLGLYQAIVAAQSNAEAARYTLEQVQAQFPDDAARISDARARVIDADAKVQAALMARRAMGGA